MKVLGVTPLYPPASRVGAWLSTHECLAHLARQGHDVKVAVQLGRSAAPYHLDGVEVHVGAGWIERLVPESDVVISHLGDSGRAQAAAVDYRVPSVRMAHGGVISDTQIAAASLVVWNSDTYRDGRPGIVVNPPVWPDRYATTHGDMVTLVNLSEDKGVKTFWRCAEQLPAVRFLGVRGAIGRQVIPRARNVEVHPGTSDMREVYGRTKILLVPSKFETWGRVGVEAMTSGIPVIAHPTPGLRESLGPAGVFIDRDDTDAWVRMITKLLRPSGWAVASKLAIRRSAELHPASDLDLLTNCLEALVAVPA